MRTSDALLLLVLLLLLILSLPTLALAETGAGDQTTREATGNATEQPRTEGPVRTLEAIEIEGELAIPQVLFITSRDHPRYRDGLRERYRKTALEIGQQAVHPRRFRSLSGHPRPQQ